MKSSNVRPLVTISTYEERKEELNKAVVMRDEVDSNSIQQTENISQLATPPPPPQFANRPANSKVSELKGNLLQGPIEPPAVPTPDYDSTPSHTLPKNKISYMNGSIKGTIGRVAATEMAKANGDAAELHSIESFKLQNLTSPIPRPPSLYFSPLSSGPPTMKKSNRPVSVTIGEYGAGQNGRKEPSKLDFIKASVENGSGIIHQAQTPKEETVSEMLRSELEKTLSRSNLKKKNEININPNNSILQNGSMSYGKPVLQKSQSSNIEKFANMLQKKQNNFETNNNVRSSTLASSNKVTINIPNKLELRKTESTPPTPTNGILKNGFGKPGMGEKSITFGN